MFVRVVVGVVRVELLAVAYVRVTLVVMVVMLSLVVMGSVMVVAAAATETCLHLHVFVGSSSHSRLFRQPSFLSTENNERN